MQVAWQPSVFMITHISGLTSQTLPKNAALPCISKLQWHYPSSYSNIENSSFYHSPPSISGKVPQICPNCHFLYKPVICRQTAICSSAGHSFSTEMISPMLQSLHFFISLLWHPHLPMRSPISQFGWAQLSFTDMQWSQECKKLFLWLPPPNIERTSFESPNSGTVLTTKNLQRSLQLSVQLQLTSKGVREKT